MNNRTMQIKKVGDAYPKQYSETRIEGILQATQDLPDDNFFLLSKEVENSFKYLPLRDDWIQTKQKMGLNTISMKETIGNCIYCDRKGYVNAVEKSTKEMKDALGNIRLKEKAFRCWCEAGKRITAGAALSRDMIKDWYPLKYNQTADDILDQF